MNQIVKDDEMETCTITKEEYEELLHYKHAFMESQKAKRKRGDAFQKLLEYRSMEAFFEHRYSDMYRTMKENYLFNQQLLQKRG